MVHISKSNLMLNVAAWLFLRSSYLKDVERGMKSYPPSRTTHVIFSVPQLCLQLSGVSKLCPLVAGVRLDPGYQVNFGGADPAACPQLPLWSLGGEVLCAQCQSLGLNVNPFTKLM